LIIPLLVSSFLSVTPAKDTVWWNTPGGTVTEHSDQNAATCSLMLYQSGGSVTFEWSDPTRTLVAASDQNWQFRDDQEMPIAMELGDVWLSDHAGSAIIEALGHGNAVAFATDQSVDDLLRSAEQIVVKTKSGDLIIAPPRGKMGVLLARAHDCQVAIGR
jgi:hypothetical protein